MNDLKQLLHDTVDTTPPGGVDIAEVMRVGRQRRARRHRGVAGVAAVAAVGVVVGGTALASLDQLGRSDPADYGNRPVGPVITLDEAKPAVEGTDYRILGRRDTRHPSSTSGVQDTGVTDDGLVVVTQEHGDPATETRVGLFDPETGEEQWLPTAPETISQAISLHEDQLLFQSGMEPGQSANQLMRDFSVLVFDRGSSTWSTLRWPGLPKDPVYEGPIEHGGRLYLTLENGDLQDDVSDLWSVALDDTGDARDEQTEVGLINITGDELTWTPTASGPDDAIHVRDLVTGEDRTFAPRSGDRCYHLKLDRIGESLLLSQSCASGAGPESERLQVVTMDGDPVVTVEGEFSVSNGSGGMAVLSEGHQPRGPFVLDPETGELWQAETQPGQPTALVNVSPLPVPQDSDLALWQTMSWTLEGDTGAPEPNFGEVYTSTQWVVEWLG